MSAHGAGTVTVVSGLPRTGTSMMMAMLQAGGLEPLTDEIRAADEDNPKGYFEYERVKALEQGDVAWLSLAEGKAVKVISWLLPKLPPDHHYRVIFMMRDLDEVLASQKRMIERREQQQLTDDATLRSLYERHLAQVREWAAREPNVDVLYVTHADMVSEPGRHLERVSTFLGGSYSVESMAAVLDRSLYRQRSDIEAGSPMRA